MKKYFLPVALLTVVASSVCAFDHNEEEQEALRKVATKDLTTRKKHATSAQPKHSSSAKEILEDIAKDLEKEASSLSATNENNGSVNAPASNDANKKQANTEAPVTTAPEVEKALFAKLQARLAACETATFACVSGLFASALKIVKPSTYSAFVKALYQPLEGQSRLQVIPAHKEALVGITAATALSVVAYVYRQKIVDSVKKAYTWTENTVNAYLA